MNAIAGSTVRSRYIIANYLPSEWIARTGIAPIDRRYALRFSFPVTFLLNGGQKGFVNLGGHVDILEEHAT